MSLQHLNAHLGDAIKSEAAVVSFVSHGARAPIDTVNAETQHASNRRLITAKSCHANTVSVQGVSGRSIDSTLRVGEVELTKRHLPASGGGADAHHAPIDGASLDDTSKKKRPRGGLQRTFVSKVAMGTKGKPDARAIGQQFNALSAADLEEL